MDIRATILARKYAQAFLNLYIDQVTPEVYSNLLSLYAYFQKHRAALIYFSLPHIALEDKLALFDQLAGHIKTEPLKKLFETLIKHNRVILTPEILNKICECYRIRKNIILFSIESSHELDVQERTCIENFLARKTGKLIESKYITNHDLIAGIRLQSNSLLWEYSIRKQINELTKLIGTKGYQ